MKASQSDVSLKLFDLKGASLIARANLTSIARNGSKVGLVCPICEIHFERYACWARRVSVNYCSKACANAGKEIRIECMCTECDKSFITNPTTWFRHSTCGAKACIAKRRSRMVKEGVLFPKKVGV